MHSNPDSLCLDLPPLPCRIGVHPGEADRPQPVRARVTVVLDISQVLRSGELADSVDYGPLHASLVATICGRPWRLLEGLGGALMEEALRPAGVTAAIVRLTKVEPPFPDAVGPVTLEFRREKE
jgi:dihydroneopterin aldolase